MNVDMEKEITARLGSARQAFEEMKNQVFLNKRLYEASLQLFHSLILSRLLYGCTIWTDLPNSLMKKLESSLTMYHRRICDVGFGRKIT